jgi:hypothetical protein
MRQRWRVRLRIWDAAAMGELLSPKCGSIGGLLQLSLSLSLSIYIYIYIYLLPKVDAASDVLMVAAGVAHGGGNRGGATSSDEI